MGHGHGAMQRRILEKLDAMADLLRPEAWYGVQGLGLADLDSMPSPSVASSFRRAAGRLGEEGVIQVTHWHRDELHFDAHPRYRKRFNGEYGFAGARTRLVVRYPPTAEDIASAVVTHQRRLDIGERARVLTRAELMWINWYSATYGVDSGALLDRQELKRAGLVGDGALF